MAGQSEEEEREMLDYLRKEVTRDEEDARLRMRDSDLWILPPERRFGKELEGEAGARAFKEALAWARWLAALTLDINVGPGTAQLLWDLEVRAEEALRRAELRASEKEGKVD